MADAMIVQPALFSEKQAAIYLSIHPRQLANDRATANVSGTNPRYPYVRLGRTIRYRKADLDGLIAASTVGADQ